MGCPSGTTTTPNATLPRPSPPHPRREKHSLRDPADFRVSPSEPMCNPTPRNCLLLPFAPQASGGRITFQMTLALEAGRDGGEGAYLISPLGCGAGQSPRRPLHARGAGEPARRHESSSRFLPAGSALLPSTRRGGSPGRWAGASSGSLAGAAGREEAGEGGEEAQQGAGNGLRPPSLLLTPPSGHTAAGEKLPLQRRRLPRRPAALRERPRG